MDKTVFLDTGIEMTPPTVFAFQAASWERCVGRPVGLKKVFRQKDQGKRHFYLHLIGSRTYGFPPKHRVCRDADGDALWQIESEDRTSLPAP